jgi:hypothetical protein
MTFLAVSYFDAGRRDEALKMREDVVTFSRKVHGPEHSDTLAAVTILAFSYSDAGRRDEALKMREQLLALTCASSANTCASDEPSPPPARIMSMRITVVVLALLSLTIRL